MALSVLPNDRSFTRIAYPILIIALLITGGAWVFHTIEKLSWLDSFYFATMTLTTIGYGDITPQHDYTKIFIIFYALIGVGTVLLLMTNIARYYIERREKQFESRYSQFRSSGIGEHLRLPKIHSRRRR